MRSRNNFYKNGAKKKPSLKSLKQGETSIVFCQSRAGPTIRQSKVAIMLVMAIMGQQWEIPECSWLLCCFSLCWRDWGLHTTEPAPGPLKLNCCLECCGTHCSADNPASFCVGFGKRPLLDLLPQAAKCLQLVQASWYWTSWSCRRALGFWKTTQIKFEKEYVARRENSRMQKFWV